MNYNEKPVGDKKNDSSIKKNERFVGESNSRIPMNVYDPFNPLNFNDKQLSFKSIRESQTYIKNVLFVQENSCFYLLHNSFMCDDEHKEFFKNIVGRFYELPKWSWSYYQGNNYTTYTTYNDLGTLLGLILTENLTLFKKYYKTFPNDFSQYRFSCREDGGRIVNICFFNKLSFEEYLGSLILNDAQSAYFYPYNKALITNKFISFKREWDGISFDLDYEFGRFSTNQLLIRQKTEDLKSNNWFIASLDWIRSSSQVEEHFEDTILNLGVYASIGLDKFDLIIETFKGRASKLGVDWCESWEEEWPENVNMKIRSLSQTFPWTKEYIFENEEMLDLDVLGLNMTVPWDIELVKFFIDRGYGGRMSENKAVYDKVFAPLLTDEILRKLFACEYTPYE